MHQPSSYLASGAPVLPDAELRRLARFIAKELEALQGLQPALLTAADVAKQYGLSRGWVYKHARDLGGQRMGTGPKARLRFRSHEVQTRLNELQTGEGETPRAARPASVQPVELLPIGPTRGGRRRASSPTELARGAPEEPMIRPTLAPPSRHN